MYLTDRDVIDYVKFKLGAPINAIEINDQEILEAIKRFTIPKFSQYVPDVKEIPLDTTDPKVQTGEDGVYFLNEPDNQMILDIVKVIPSSAGPFMFNYPIIGVSEKSMKQVADTLLDLTETKTSMDYSLTEINYIFYPPNRIRLLPNNLSFAGNYFIVRYERTHPNFATIPAAYTNDFLELAFADVAEYLASVRSKFSNFSTPWGEVNLNWDSLLSRASEARDKVIERLKRRPPDVLVRVR